MTDERLDLEISRFLAWQAEDIAGAPRAADVAAAMGARLGVARLPMRLTQGLAWLMLLLALLATAILGAFVVGSLLQRDEPRGEHSPITLGAGAWGSLVEARDGRLWSSSEQGISVYDPSTGETRVFGLADDPLFARAWVLAAAADGGIWLAEWEADRFVRYDGTEFADAIEFPGGSICALSDGDELTVLACDGTVARLEDSTWTTLAGSFPGSRASSFAIDGAESIWVIGPGDEGPAGVWEHRAGTWLSHDPTLAADGIVAAPDGSVWVWGLGDRELGAVVTLARHDGTDWRRFSPTEMGVGEVHFLALAADGSVWGTGDRFGLVSAFRYDGDSFTTFRLLGTDGSPESGRPWVSGGGIVAAEAGVFAAVGGALAQLIDDQFEVVDPGPPGSLWQIQGIAVDSQGTAWLLTRSADDSGRYLPAQLGRVAGGEYEELNQRGEAISLGPDGRIWMATREGPMRLEGDSFELVGPGLSLATPSTLDVQDLPPYAVARDGTPYTVLRGAGETIVRLADGTWQELPHFEFAGAITAMAVAPDQTLWVITGGPEPALLRFDGDRWSPVSQPERSLEEMVSIAFDRDGTAWLDVLIDAGCVDDYAFGSRWCPRGVARLNRGEWTVTDEVAGQSLGRRDVRSGRPLFGDLAVSADGTVWLPTDHGVARFDGQHWSLVVELWRVTAVAAGLDGSVWAAGIGIHRLGIAADGGDDD